MRTNLMIVSGGQTGVDQAALRAALKCQVQIGGWCPPGRRCEAGTIPEHFPLRATPRDRSHEAPDVPRSQRTQWNVRDSDATLILRRSPARDPGTEWTTYCASRYGRPLLICELGEPLVQLRICRWLRSFPVGTLNVAGPSENSEPGIGQSAYDTLLGVLLELRADSAIHA